MSSTTASQRNSRRSYALGKPDEEAKTLVRPIRVHIAQPGRLIQYTHGFMRTKILATLALLIGMLPAAEIPRKATEFPIQLPNGKQVLVSQYRGKVLCLVFILTT